MLNTLGAKEGTIFVMGITGVQAAADVVVTGLADKVGTGVDVAVFVAALLIYNRLATITERLKHMPTIEQVDEKIAVVDRRITDHLVQSAE